MALSLYSANGMPALHRQRDGALLRYEVFTKSVVRGRQTHELGSQDSHVHRLAKNLRVSRTAHKSVGLRVRFSTVPGGRGALTAARAGPGNRLGC